MSLDRVLDDYESGQISREELKRSVMKYSFVDAGCAKVDHHREMRTGGPEVVYCEGKTPEQVAVIMGELHEHSGQALGTRAGAEHFEAVRDLEHAHYDPVSRLIRIGPKPEQGVGKIIVVSAGTSDMPVAEEAAQTAEFLGSRVHRHYDCGVAGIHRLFAVVDEFQDATAVIAVAGMEGALASVVGGLSSPPVIAVPTSVGYGASFNGLAALLAMMNSCAPGVAVVNIDNGFGAGFMAHNINIRAQSDGNSRR